jgi:hypothetical protein
MMEMELHLMIQLLNQLCNCLNIGTNFQINAIAIINLQLDLNSMIVFSMLESNFNSI